MSVKLAPSLAILMLTKNVKLISLGADGLQSLIKLLVRSTNWLAVRNRLNTKFMAIGIPMFICKSLAMLIQRNLCGKNDSIQICGSISTAWLNTRFNWITFLSVFNHKWPPLTHVGAKTSVLLKMETWKRLATLKISLKTFKELSESTTKWTRHHMCLLTLNSGRTRKTA